MPPRGGKVRIGPSHTRAWRRSDRPRESRQTPAIGIAAVQRPQSGLDRLNSPVTAHTASLQRKQIPRNRWHALVLCDMCQIEAPILSRPLGCVVIPNSAHRVRSREPCRDMPQWYAIVASAARNHAAAGVT